MDDKDLDRLLTEMRRSYNVPPERVPVDEMWGRIQGEAFTAPGGRAGRLVGRAPRAIWWIGLAAALVVGVGIGRLTTVAPPQVVSGDSSRLASPAPRAADPYDRATTRYFGQTAALLIALPAEARAGRTDQRFVARAAELLTTTRLLLDSPAAADPRVRALLEDVELVLAQVASLESDRGRVEFELIAQALEQRDLLPRLTSAVAGNSEADD
jgi:hypothetical protein